MPRRRRHKDLPRFALTVVEGVAGLIQYYKASSGLSWEEMGKECDLAPRTLRRIADLTTKNPHVSTFLQILRGMDQSSVIQHSMLERYRKYTKKQIRVIVDNERKKAA